MCSYSNYYNQTILFMNNHYRDSTFLWIIIYRDSTMRLSNLNFRIKHVFSSFVTSSMGTSARKLNHHLIWGKFNWMCLPFKTSFKGTKSWDFWPLFFLKPFFEGHWMISVAPNKPFYGEIKTQLKNLDWLSLWTILFKAICERGGEY